jgi:hypothetical protein
MGCNSALKALLEIHEEMLILIPKDLKKEIRLDTIANQGRCIQK